MTKRLFLSFLLDKNGKRNGVNYLLEGYSVL